LSWLVPLKTIFKHFVLPPASLLILGLLGLLLLRWRPRLARLCLLVSIGSLWLLATPVVSDTLTQWVERYPPADLSKTDAAQAIVILGGGGQRAFAPEYAGAAVEPYLLERVAYGAFVAKKTGLPVLVTGFEIEAQAMHDTLLRNFDIEARWVDSQAHDTFENAQNAARLLQADGARRIILVTRATHMGRAVHEFTAAGLEVIPAPVGVMAPRSLRIYDYLPDPETLLRSHIAIYEMLGEPVRRFLSATHLRRH
jgi:uncharacterized SAM-binding protein YcdF (DUF218 family)